MVQSSLPLTLRSRSRVNVFKKTASHRRSLRSHSVSLPGVNRLRGLSGRRPHDPGAVGSLGWVHGSPWRYDTFVPVIFAGASIEGAKVSREVTPYDIAPTIANYLGITPPSGSTGQPLAEVLKH